MGKPLDSAPNSYPLILFDGVCNLCNSTVDFILRRDKRGLFRFASLQSEPASRLMRERGLDPGSLDSVVLMHGDRVYLRSSAALRIAGLLGGPLALTGVFWLVPKPLRDAVYRWVAANRYRWFGRRDTCRVPTAAEQARFLG
jgi:predicted DCC family thiol-disulfide oxidoreductase YuxK